MICKIKAIFGYISNGIEINYIKNHWQIILYEYTSDA